ncbi:MAG TPA: hypothetical protein VOA88_10325 [Candidatus Dormibacteraeota bacterium]|nr:hypothetical protein [Candidatus Dormibacteraeota bacterium]
MLRFLIREHVIEAIEPVQTAQYCYEAATANLSAAKREGTDATKAIALYKNEHHGLRTARLGGRQAICVGAMETSPDGKLERVWREKRQQFISAQEEFAKAKKDAGLASY